MTDIKERLRGNSSHWSDVMRQAADEIERLEARVAELEEALEAMADDYEEFGYNPDTGKWDVPLFNKPVHDMARAALSKARGQT